MTIETANAAKFIREALFYVDQMPPGRDTEADENDTSPKDMNAHLSELVYRWLIRALEALGEKP